MGQQINSKIWLYDTTLRDGTQSEDISFQVSDKIRIAKELDALGIHYIEGGWPGSNPKDIAFFKEIKKETLLQAKIAAFGSTRRGVGRTDGRICSRVRFLAHRSVTSRMFR